MIELNSKTQQDFLNREWVEKLLDSGVDMSDAKYYIGTFTGSSEQKDYIFDKCYTKFKAVGSERILHWNTAFTNIRPTYTVSELLNKLHGYIYPTIDGKKFSGGLKLLKNAPFYTWYYELKCEQERIILIDECYIRAEAKYPIESLASLLIQCYQREIGIEKKILEI